MYSRAAQSVKIYERRYAGKKKFLSTSSGLNTSVYFIGATSSHSSTFSLSLSLSLLAFLIRKVWRHLPSEKKKSFSPSLVESLANEKDDRKRSFIYLQQKSKVSSYERVWLSFKVYSVTSDFQFSRYSHSIGDEGEEHWKIEKNESCETDVCL